MPQDFTPSDKKRKSLERDGRNCYGENDKSSRKAVRRRKEIVNRTFRRTTKQELSKTEADADGLNELVNQLERIDWKKVPDKPLGSHLLDKLVSQIIKRITAASNPELILGVLETQLLDADAPPQAVQDIMRQLHGIVRARGSIDFPAGTRSTRLKIDCNFANAIIDILNHNEA